MSVEKDNYKVIAAAGLGALGGLILGNYLWKTQSNDRTLSKLLATLSKVLEQIEGINTKEAEDLKERILNILKTIESHYGNTEE